MTNQTPRPALLAAMVTMIGVAAGAALVSVAWAEATLQPAKPAQVAAVVNPCGKEFTYRKFTETSFHCVNAMAVLCREGYSATQPTLRHTKGTTWNVAYLCEKDATPR